MSPAECWDLIAHLPGDSALMAALAADPDYAADAEPGPPSYRDFGPEVRVLADCYDMLGLLVRVVAGLGGKPPDIKPYPRPRDPGAPLRAARARDEWLVLNQMLTGGR